MGIFKANDIRGIYPEELDGERIRRIGYNLPAVLKAEKILVGRDARNSSDEIFDVLSQGIRDAGANVVDIGVCDTPAVYFATVHYGFSGSVMITASHNPPEYNGLKISGKSAVPVGPDTGLKEIETLITEPLAIMKKRGKVESLNIEDDYSAHVHRFLGRSSRLKVVMDCGNGAASIFIHDIFDDYFFDSCFLFDTPDGDFPNHGPNPLDKGSWVEIHEAILERNADIGILFDGDADRVIFFDETGNFISPDIITALIGQHYYGRKKSDKPMFYDIRSSKSVSEYISSLGGTSSACVTGHANIKKLLKSKNGLYAGELSGHYYFSENFYCDSGFIAAAIVCDVLEGFHLPLSQIVQRINPYSFSGEKNFSVRSTEFVLEKVKSQYSDGDINEMDGIRIDYKDWWFNLRPSGAEPLLRLVVEADTIALMEEKVGEVSGFISSIED